MGVSLNKVVNVDVQVSAYQSITSDFNLGCIIGKSLQDKAGTVTIYSVASYATEMISDGFTVSDPEYKKAVAYFSQNPRANRIAIGEYDEDGTVVEGFNAIRAANVDFYSFCFAEELTDSNIALIAAAVEASGVPTLYIYQTDSANCLAASTTNILKTIKEAGYRRSFGFYSNDDNMDAAIVGLISGLSTMETNSAYSIAFKKLTGISAENLTDTQYDNLMSYNGNAYLNYGDRYDFVYPGVSGAGFHVDEMYLIDAATTLIQQSVITGLIAQRKVPYTESGMDVIVNFISRACNTLNEIGLIASGIWKGEQVQDLSYGDAVNNGYYIYSGTVADQTAEQKAARISPPIYVALLAAGAIEAVNITVYINR